jgi:glutathione S-transferase
MDWTLSTLYGDIISTCFIQLVRTTSADRNYEALELAAKRAGEKLAILNRQLSQRHYILGDQLTIADIAVGTLMYRYFNMDIPRPPLANVEVWYKRLSQRPAYQSHVMVDFKPMMVPGA